MRYSLLLACTLAWGLAVFLPKLARASLSPAGVVLANALGYLVMLPLVLSQLQPADRQLGPGYALGLAVGILFVLGNYCYYLLLGDRQVAALAPLTALYVVIPVALGLLLLGERLTARQWSGAALAVLAVYLLSTGPRPVAAE